MNAQPIQLMPFGLAIITSALFPKTSVGPFNVETVEFVTSLRMTFAGCWLSRFAFALTCPPIMETPVSFELLRIRPLRSIL